MTHDLTQQKQKRQEEEREITPTDAIRIQQELKRCGCEPVAAECHGRMFPSQYGSPSQMLRWATPYQLSGERQQREKRNHTSFLSSLSASYIRVEPCIHHKCKKNKKCIDTIDPQSTKTTMKPPPFPSIAARLENDIALGLAASLWDSGNVVGHCNDRLAHLLVLSTTIVQSMRKEERKEKEVFLSLQLREAFMSLIEHLVYLECVAANALLRTPSKPQEEEKEEEYFERTQGWWLKCSESDFFYKKVTEMKIPSVYFTTAVESTTRVLKGLVEPKTLTGPTVSPTWQYSLVRTANDVPNRYDILDAIAYVLQPCRNLTIRRTFCAVARQLGLDILRAAGEDNVGIRGAAAAIHILQYINGRALCLTVEEREVARKLGKTLEKKEQYLTALMSPEILNEATQPIRELIREVYIFGGT
ncbi:uncharacterized protein TM35_000122450 [Trypanosoma theileri]|uniref:Uncharacterized protein n=1 Tax=Trypanosoma theileri TaxID=67003 RepID=A0A1X0NZA3_9TRYP|nr:uncharacterized protein TM35_000122450 [Trypanosoma theileri]ORC89470.1 hypothetical protein TM35_000122450 [Trypanosoma theileri]